VEGGGNSEPVEVSKTPVKVKGSFAVRVGAPAPVPLVMVSVMTGVPIPVAGSVVVPLKTPLSVSVAMLACAGNAEAPDNAIAKAAETKPRDEFPFIMMGNVPSIAKRARRAAIPR
jgi:hypothetical protein